MDKQERENLKDRKDREKRLADAFGDEWRELPRAIKDRCIDEYQILAGSTKKDPVKLLDTVFDKRIGFGLFILALLLGIIASIIANSIDRVVLPLIMKWLPESGDSLYVLTAMGVFALGVFALDKRFEQITNEDLHSGKFLESLLDRVSSTSKSEQP